MQSFSIKSFWAQALFFGAFMTVFSAVLGPVFAGNDAFSWHLVGREAFIWFPAGVVMAYVNKKYNTTHKEH
jgi:hypothetical protein